MPITPKLRIGAITDEFSFDLRAALHEMSLIGMTGAELRIINGKNILDLSNEEIQRATDQVNEQGMEVIAIASPLLKCILPNAPDLDMRFEMDVFGSRHTFDDQPRLVDRAFEIAALTGAKVIRVFSYWRTVEPERCIAEVGEALSSLGARAQEDGLTIGLENEHACNVGTATEAATVLQAVANPSVKLVWDPANALVAGEEPFPLGFKKLPADRIVHVHVKDCHLEGSTPIWGPLGTRHVNWRGQIAALLESGYSGWLSLETHWPGPGSDKLEASRICGWNLRGLAAG